MNKFLKRTKKVKDGDDVNRNDINRNDMFWTCCLFEHKDGEFEWYHIKWFGYNDDYWWDNVSEKASIVTCKGDKGTEKKFRLNYKTLDVVEVE